MKSHTTEITTIITVIITIIVESQHAFIVINWSCFLDSNHIIQLTVSSARHIRYISKQIGQHCSGFWSLADFEALRFWDLVDLQTDEESDWVQKTLPLWKTLREKKVSQNKLQTTHFVCNVFFTSAGFWGLADLQTDEESLRMLKALAECQKGK